MPGFLIGDIAERAGVPAATIRYYESLGLMNPPARSSAGYRRYGESAVEELRFIRKAQALGFSPEGATGTVFPRSVEGHGVQVRSKRR